ncbi:MAG: hypothetical protein ABSG07_21745 [Terriglobales bacterium]|jgi:hypothetical protein
MSDDRVSNKKGKFPTLHQISQQKCIFTTECGRVKQPSLDRHI